MRNKKIYKFSLKNKKISNLNPKFNVNNLDHIHKLVHQSEDHSITLTTLSNQKFYKPNQALPIMINNSFHY